MLKFQKVPKYFWSKGQNQKQFFDWLGTHLGYKEMEDWYNVRQENIHKCGGKELLSGYYNNSPSKALQSVYGEHTWVLWKFGQTPKGFWKKIENQRQYFDWL